jgi:ribosomal protein L37AE/L43A
MTDNSFKQAGDAICPECGNKTLRVSDAIFADCIECGAAIERNEVGI